MAAAVSLKKKIEGLGGELKFPRWEFPVPRILGFSSCSNCSYFFFPPTHNARTQGYVSTKRAKKIIRERRGTPIKIKA